MEEIKLIASIVVTILSLIISILFTFFKLCRAKSKYKALENDEDLYSLMLELMKIAEGFIDYNGEEKKEYVLTKLNQFAIDNKLKFNKEELDKKLEDFISLSKNVNNKESKNGQE